MMHKVAALTALVALAVGQDAISFGDSSTITSSAPLAEATYAASSSSTSSPVTHTIAVGKGGHIFSPDVTLAEVGDIIEFQFYPTNHSVVRAAYEYPCVPYEMVEGVGHYGFWSGWKPVDAVLADPPTYQVRVNDSDPIFYYCGAPGSCITYQMVGVINPNANTSLEYQKQLAEQSKFSLLPGEDWPDEASIPSGVTTSSSSATATSTTSIAAATSAASTSSSHAALSPGAIAGIAIGGAAVLLAAGIAIWYCGRQSNRSRMPTPGAPAQEINTGYNPAMGSTYGKSAHMSMASGYSMPPNYDQGMRSPVMSPATPVDPMTGQQQNLMYSAGMPSPSLSPSVPAYGQSHMTNMYAVGTHNLAPVEMSGESSAPPRRSIEKNGVERYS